MAEPEFSFTDNAAPIVEIGLGDSRVPTGDATWDSAVWDDADAVWVGGEPTWRDVSCYAVEAEVARGRDRATDRFAPGTAGVVLNNADGWADMAGSPLEVTATSLRPGRSIRIGVDVYSIGRVWLFRGVIDRVAPAYDPVRPDNVKLDCVDMLGEVGHIKLLDSPPVGGDDTVPERINRILDACRHPVDKRIVNHGATAYLDTSQGTVSTPDIAVPASFHILAHVRKTTRPSGVDATIASQATSPGQYGWQLYIPGAGTNGIGLNHSTVGTSFNGLLGVNATTPPGTDVWIGQLLDRPSGSVTFNGLASADGVTWVNVGGGGTVGGPVDIFDSSAPITIGATLGAARWDGRIYWVEMRTGVVPGAGTVVWRFDASEHGGGIATTYTDPRGLTWTLSGSSAIVGDVRVTQTTYGSQAIDLLGLAADSAGGIVYSDGDGNIAYEDFGWQNYDYAAGADAAIGNIVAGIPGTPAITPPAYLIDTGAPVTLPDTSTLTLPASFTIFTTVRLAAGGAGAVFLAGQWSTGQFEWKITRNRASGQWLFTTSADGTATTSHPFTVTDTPPTGADETWALSVILDTGAGTTMLRAYRRAGGDDLNPVWVGLGPSYLPLMPWVNRTAPISIGTAVGETAWPGRIYDIELANASTPTPPGATVWRFDVDDTTAGTSSWTDPRGRVWTVGGASAGHVHPATIPATPGVLGDVCPAGWEISYDRQDLATQVELNRQLPEPVPRLRWNLDGSAGVGAALGYVRMNNSDQTLVTVLSFSDTDADATNAEPFLRNMGVGTEIRLSDVGDTTNNTRTYESTGGPVLFPSPVRNYRIPVAWTDGATGIGGLVELQASFIAPAAYVLDDPAGQSLYNVETFSMTDLIAVDGNRFPALAARALATRGYTAMPRLEAVLLDAKAARGDTFTMETMATCLPELPSRYLCRLRHEDGRMVFDRNMFAVGTRHFISRDDWSLRITLDDADWAGTPHGIVDAAEGNDISAIVGVHTAPLNVFGTIAASEDTADASAIVGAIGPVGVVAGSEAADVSAIAAIVVTNPVGTIAATEAADVGAIRGGLV
jgi:hypothetical protein